MVWEIIRIKMENRVRKISLLEMGKVKAKLWSWIKRLNCWVWIERKWIRGMYEEYDDLFLFLFFTYDFSNDSTISNIYSQQNKDN